MLPTFVIGLREGLEAALIVGIIAAFLGQQGRKDALRQVWFGTAAAVAICIGIAIALQVISSDLPQRQQEGLETVVGALAVGMVTYMILFMRQARPGTEARPGGRGGLGPGVRVEPGPGADGVPGRAARGFRDGGVPAGHLSRLRGCHHLLARRGARDPAGGDGGYAIYKGGVRLNLARFFRITGLVLVVVAAGLVMTAFHTANEAGWLSVGQTQAFDLSWLVRPGTPLSSLLTGVLGIQPYPVWIEVIAWLAYLVPMVAIVAWPAGKPARRPVAAEAPAGRSPARPSARRRNKPAAAISRPPQ